MTMTKKAVPVFQTYDLHITVDPNTFDPSKIGNSWKVLDIRNVQGMPHCIVSRKYVGNFLAAKAELDRMTDKLVAQKASVQRKKIELHFRTSAEISLTRDAIGIIEVHYKYKLRGMFYADAKQIEELNRKNLALSFNAVTKRVIVSARFADLAAYEKGKAPDKLPKFLEDEEREIVVMDTNNELDSFWPLRTSRNHNLKFEEFPRWIPRA